MKEKSQRFENLYQDTLLDSNVDLFLYPYFRLFRYFSLNVTNQSKIKPKITIMGL